MTNHRTIDESVADFGRRAAPLMAAGDRAAVRALFARQLADARVANQEEQWTVKEVMREALREVLMAPSRRVKTGWFDDL
jgi:hypothetical protein